LIVELGSGIGNLKQHIPECICTDMFPNPWIDQVENAYRMSFADESVSNLILFDVFHHLEYPKAALNEFRRVLKPHGRVILFEPCISALGWIVYGAFHKEPVAWFDKINPDGGPISDDRLGYYAAQGNACRIFRHSRKYRDLIGDFSITKVRRYAALAYVMSGGYSGRQLYPDRLYPFIMRKGFEPSTQPLRHPSACSSNEIISKQ
jgi:methyltransferase type 11